MLHGRPVRDRGRRRARRRPRSAPTPSQIVDGDRARRRRGRRRRADGPRQCGAQRRAGARPARRPDVRDRVVLCPAPLVEGLVVAAVAAAGGASRAEVAAEAAARAAGQDGPPRRRPPSAGRRPTPTSPSAERASSASSPSRTRTACTPGRPRAWSARCARSTPRSSSATCTTGSAPVPAGSLSRVATLGALRGHEVEVRASGRRPHEARRAPAHAGRARVRRAGPATAPPRRPSRRPRRAPIGAGRCRPRRASRSARLGAGRGAGRPSPTTAGRRPGRRVAAARRGGRRGPPGGRAGCGRAPRARSARPRPAIFDAHLLLLDDAELLADVQAPDRRRASAAARPGPAAVDGRRGRVGRAARPLPAGARRRRPRGRRPGAARAARARRDALGRAADGRAGRARPDPRRGGRARPGRGWRRSCWRTAAPPRTARSWPGPGDPGGRRRRARRADDRRTARSSRSTAAPASSSSTRRRTSAGSLPERAADARAATAPGAAPAPPQPAVTRDGVDDRRSAPTSARSPTPARPPAPAPTWPGWCAPSSCSSTAQDAPDVDEQEAVYRGDRRGARRPADHAAHARRRRRQAAVVPADAGRGQPVPRRARASGSSLARPELLRRPAAGDRAGWRSDTRSASCSRWSATRRRAASRPAQLLDDGDRPAGGVPPAGLHVGMMVEVPAAALKIAAFAPSRRLRQHRHQRPDPVHAGRRARQRRRRRARRPARPRRAAAGRPRSAGAPRAARRSRCAASSRPTSAPIPLLVGLGVRELSVTPHAVPAIKEAVSAVDVAAASVVAGRALEQPGPAEVRALLG